MKFSRHSVPYDIGLLTDHPTKCIYLDVKECIGIHTFQK